MGKVIHVIGNGDSAALYKPTDGTKITCNLPPFTVENVHATCMVDFKMMRAINEGSLKVPGDWVLGFRPKKFCEMNPQFHMKYAQQIKEFYTALPKYAGNYTSFNCGHMAVYYSADRLKGTEIHMYGFDSIIDYNLRSCTDFYLQSDRGDANNYRLLNLWRPIWIEMFKEFSETQFVLHHKHDNVKDVSLPKNVEILSK